MCFDIYIVSSMQPDSHYAPCTMSANFADTCVVERVFNHAAADRVMHIKVNCSFGACTSEDELVVQLNHIGEYQWCIHDFTVC